ncbi:MAG: hypothetical protein RBS01_02410 [Candidatus Dojkabacteria bacterium]|jgi:hypothetical protein|nr:hypothetical protein [Candidatus Dojkabacteria bacterium]
MKKYILNKHIRFRKEDGYILVCNCKRLLDYELPIEYFDFLESLKVGVNMKDISKGNLIVLKDFEILDIVVKEGKNVKKQREDIFKKLSYDDSEFV